MQSIYKYISLVLFVVFAQAAQAQAAQTLATVANPEFRAVPELTGDVAKDAEISVVRNRDFALFEKYQTKMEAVFGGKLNVAQRTYLHSVGIPDLTYTGNAQADWQYFKDAYRAWKAVHEADLPVIQQRLANLNKN